MRMIDVHKRRIDTQKPSFYVLDGIESAIHGWSLARKMRRQYTGNVFAVRRKDISVSQINIGFFRNLTNTNAYPTGTGWGTALGVSTLYDQVGSRNFVQTNFNLSPVVRASSVNIKVGGRVYAKFNGSNEFMATSDSETPILDKDCTVFVVFESQAGENVSGVFEEIRSNLSPSNHRVVIYSDRRTINFLHSNYSPIGSGSLLVFPSQQPASTRRIFVFKKTGTLIEAFDENGFVDDITSSDVFSVNTLLEIGRQLAGDQYFGGKFAEGIICNDGLDSTDYDKIMDNLKDFFL